jgi:hypothetical protein
MDAITAPVVITMGIIATAVLFAGYQGWRFYRYWRLGRLLAEQMKLGSPSYGTERPQITSRGLRARPRQAGGLAGQP